MMMLEELRQKESEFNSRLAQVGEFLKIGDKVGELAALEEKMNAPDFWNNKDAAQETIGAATACRNVIQPYRKMEEALADFTTALELAVIVPKSTSTMPLSFFTPFIAASVIV